jgi:hypothetical protein
MIGDPNWLYSTIAQSAAAIVAIVGGFITASVLSLNAGKRSLINQKKDKEARLETKKEQSKDLTIELKELEIEDLTEDVTYELISAEELPSLEDLILAHTGTQTLDLEISKQECERLYKQALEAKNFIEQHSDKINIMNAVTFDEWVRTNNFDISKYNHEMLEREYNRAEEKQRKSLSESEHLILDTRQPHIYELIKPMPPIISRYKQQKLESLREKVRENTREIAALEHDVNDLDLRISNFSYPPLLGWGLVILGWFAFVSIVMPVMLIMVGNWGMARIYSKPAEQLTFILFVLGLVAVFVYIALQLRERRRK